MVKIFRKVAAKFSRRLRLLGGGGANCFCGGGWLNILGNKWNFFCGAEFFHGNCNFSWGTFSVAGSVF